MQDDGKAARGTDAEASRRIGELLLRVDELEDTLHLLEENPTIRPSREGATREEAIHRLEERIRAERGKLEALERCGAIDYIEIERAIRISEMMG